MIASLETGGQPHPVSGHMLAALLADETLSRTMRESCPSLAALPAEAVRQNLADLAAGSEESEPGRRHGAAGRAGSQPRQRRCAARRRPARPVLHRPHRAGQGRQDRPDPRPRSRDPADGRHPDPAAAEQPDPHRRGRRRQDGGRRRAWRCASRPATCRDALKGVQLMSLDLGLLQAGAGVKGEFENRLKGVIDAVKSSPTADHPVHRRGPHADRRRRPGRAERRRQPAEAGSRARRAALHRGHDLGRVQEVLREGRRADPPLPGGEGRGAERAAGRRHAARPGRARSRSITVCASSTRRWRKPSSCPRASSRRGNCPTRACRLLDTACARVAMSQAAMPAPVEDRTRRIALIETELGAIGRESRDRHGPRRRASRADRPNKETAQAELDALNERWAEEKELVATHPRPARARDGSRLDRCRRPTRGRPPPAEERSWREALQGDGELHDLQGEEPLVHPVVDGQAVAEVVATWTGIPVGRMVSRRDQDRAGAARTS